MALLALAGRAQATDGDFKLLLGVEEPELYQHPPQARFLANALSTLASGKAQVLVTTHSPYFVSGRTFESIRVLRKCENQTKVFTWSIDEQRQYCADRKGIRPIGAQAALSGIDRSLQTNIAELFFAEKIVLVEGIEDVGIVEAYLQKKGRLKDFLKAGCHIVPLGGKQKMPMVIALARGFSIDVFCIFDMDLEGNSGQQSNAELIKYAKDVDDIIPVPTVEEFAGKRFFGWYNNIQDSIVNETPQWNVEKEAVANSWGWTAAKMKKDPLLLAEVVKRIDGDIPALDRLVARLEQFWAS